MRSWSILLFLIAGCEPGAMHPGSACASCHTGGGGFGKSGKFGAAGTIYTAALHGSGVADVRVAITDADGQSLSLTSNEAGNFYTSQPLRPPLAVTLSRAGASVSSTAPGGDCNGCHTGAQGRLHLP